VRSSLSLLLGLPLLALAASPANAAEQAGVSAAVRGQVALTRQQIAVGRQVVGGEPILLQDAIQSGQKSGMQILLLDETVFTIGPESELVIDEFVYDPRTNAGKLSAEITKGVFRFVSGKIAHEEPEDMNVKLPAGTLGVRGTMVAGRVDPAQKSSRLVLLGEGPENDTGAPAGSFLACNAGECVHVSRPGFGTSIDGPDSPPSAPFRFTQEELDELTRSVSDPTGWFETAAAKGVSEPDVAAGPDDGAAGPGESTAAQDEDTRTASDVSGIDTAAGTAQSETVQKQLRTLDGLAQATSDVAQFAEQTVLVNGRPVEIGNDCVSNGSCPTPAPLPLPEDITTFDQLATLATTGVGNAVYQQSNVGLINTNGAADGSYDFSLDVSLAARTAELNVSNLSSQILGLSEVAFGQLTDFSSYPPGYNIPLGFSAVSLVTQPGVCANGCSAFGTAYLANGNGRIADSAIHAVVVTAQPDPTTVLGTVTANPYAPIPRP
jgi:FecR protein